MMLTRRQEIRIQATKEAAVVYRCLWLTGSLIASCHSSYRAIVLLLPFMVVFVNPMA